MIYSGGLKIVTTENAKIQSALEKIYENERNFPSSGVLTPPQSTAAIVDSHTGALLAIVGARGEKTADRTLNYATRLTRSPGSVIKPLSVYAPALDKGLITWRAYSTTCPSRSMKQTTVILCASQQPARILRAGERKSRARNVDKHRFGKDPPPARREKLI
jgi:membrane peptidoglycan carboxypeptidase